MPGWLLPIFLFVLMPFLPVRFHIFYENRGVDDHFSLEMIFLHVFRWRRKISVIRPRLEKWGVLVESGREHRLPAEKDVSVNRREAKVGEIVEGLKNLLRRLEKYGLGATLLSFFIPVKYHRHLTAIQRLENKGSFIRFEWRTRIGTNDAARTAVSYGLLWGAVGAIMALLQSRYVFARRPRLEVTPSFGDAVLDTRVDCIFELKIGQIILTGFREMGRRRILQGKGE